MFLKNRAGQPSVANRQIKFYLSVASGAWREPRAAAGGSKASAQRNSFLKYSVADNEPDQRSSAPKRFILKILCRHRQHKSPHAGNISHHR